jgi:hypothetical protein
MKKSELLSFVRSGKQVRLTRRRPSEPRLNGYILGMSDSLLLIHCFNDFKPDGYTICRIRDIVELRHGPYEVWFDHILRSESLLTGLKFRYRIDLSNWATALQNITRRYSQIIIECESVDEKEEDFYIGGLLAIQSRNIQFRDYDALGYWSKTPKSIKLADITKVQFDTPYINIFSKYTREDGPLEEFD